MNRQTLLLALLGVCVTAVAAVADVYYTYENGVYTLSSVQQTEVFKPAFAAGEGSGPAPAVSFAPTAFESLLVKYSNQYRVDINLIKAVMMAESGMRHTDEDGNVIASNKGAVGIMQVMPATGAGLGLPNLNDLETNIHAGVKYLAQMLRRFDNKVVFAVAAYNAGPGAVAEARGIPNFPETRNYVAVVLKHLQSGNFSGASEAAAAVPAARPLRQFTDSKGNVVLTNIY